MGTSNWQHIPFVVDALMRIEPTRVLDVGVGFGRWGILAREFGDVWPGRVHRKDWTMRVEGIEAFAPNVADYHRAFYDLVHQGDAIDILPTLTQPFDLVMFGDVLEHFERPAADTLLDLAVERHAYVIVNVPLGPEHPQGEAYGNPYEAHRSAWELADFQRRPLVRHALFRDYIHRPYGSFILSRDDPRGVRHATFSESDHGMPLHRKVAIADELGGRTLLRLVWKKALRRLRGGATP